MSEVTGRLEFWHVSVPAITGEVMVWGDVYDDERGRFNNGTYIHTSGCENKEYKEGDVVVTRNSTYLLGEKLDV